MGSLLDILLPLGCSGCSASCEVTDKSKEDCKKSNGDDDNHETASGLVGS